MVDRLGQPLEVGDKVLYISGYYKKLKKGKVFSISAKRVRILEATEAWVDLKDVRWSTKQCSPEQVVKVL